MINEQALEEVRGSVMRKLRRRRAGKWSAAASVAVVCLALLMPTKQVSVVYPVNVYPVKDRSGDLSHNCPSGTGIPACPGLPVNDPVLVTTSPVRYQTARVNKRPLPKPEPMKEGPPPAYIKILTDDPNVVFLLVNSENGGTE